MKAPIQTWLLLLTALVFGGCRQRNYSNVTLMTSQPWAISQTKTCFLTSDSKDRMRMHCAAYGDPDTGVDGDLSLVNASFDKAVHTDSLYGVVCRLDSPEHATCSSGK